MEQYAVPVILGVLFGFGGRMLLLKNDYRQYPTQPHGMIIHLTLGFIAAGLGSIAIPALLEQEYTAITFLALAAQQFREVRNMERETLAKMDEMELVSRGKTYIEGIALTFEGRNYMTIIIASATTLATTLVEWWLGLIVGVVGVGIALWFKSGKFLDSIADIEPAEVRLEGPDVFVNDIHIMNVGLADSRELIKKQALGVILKPKSIDSMVTLANLGQRQAVLHDLSVGLGVYRDDDKPSLVPLSRRNLDDGRVAIFFIPQIKDMDWAIRVISQVPILENAVHIPSESEASSKEGGR
ncbi:cytochrome c biogenesis protein CcdA [Caldalkalibacillus uzonensis]|uniref:Cytochrome c biogenesis protein CcdA n=1 Tax=Caldalkalibacillus uzonensis TaxID=353224 RepID=A0ABU0CPE7_9BACI|nr:YIEGIA family protein [Caldalkalibacillus uzonensis]MDQ0337759.1 cytochrome c biogenesis protein CcdA [Caldalkalibacillus uzonensis]